MRCLLWSDIQSPFTPVSDHIFTSKINKEDIFPLYSFKISCYRSLLKNLIHEKQDYFFKHFKKCCKTLEAASLPSIINSWILHLGKDRLFTSVKEMERLLVLTLTISLRKSIKESNKML